jgi:hypothetical protein
MPAAMANAASTENQSSNVGVIVACAVTAAAGHASASAPRQQGAETR